jgi:hypothetical protein
LASTLIIACISLSLCFSGCGSVDEPSGYDTQAIEKLQEEVPFAIVVPTYLPDDIGPDPYIVQGPFKVDEEILWIEIEYQKRGGSGKVIIIDEQNSMFYVNADWASYPERTYLDIAGIKVREETTEAVPYPTDEPINYGFRYVWNKGGTDFLVDIFGYEKDECRKIIESMIQQVE